MTSPAEFRGPGVHHNYDESDSGYEMDIDGKSRGYGAGGSRGRIIFLGDGTEVLTGSDDTEMFDNVDEDKDLESQVSKNNSTSKEKDDVSTSTAVAESKQESEAQSKTGQEIIKAPAAAFGQQDEKKGTKAVSTSDESKKE